MNIDIVLEICSMKNATIQNRYYLHTLLFIFTFSFTPFLSSAQEMNISIPWKASIEAQKGEEIITVPAIEGNEFDKYHQLWLGKLEEYYTKFI